MNLERVNRILYHDKYKEYLNKILKYEEKREFCKHDMQHFLDAARITYILNLENNLGIDKEVIYALGLLHDIGRWREYEEGIPHNVASCDLSDEILIDSGFTEKEREQIKSAILNHRNSNENKDELENKSLLEIFYRADKLSRSCFNCKNREKCNWTNEKKNLNIYY
ncbi:HD domain-containing protein [Clostridium sp. MB40-C1]|uniref:HD domain-containing protein n=1 Tax=Clostridium sp. MB40-C1 TaxID=3070996 RepID=UPI0027E1DAD0|nr:HD domain-containing protein [Clostridium sp. MB40-C1]WMJ80906.1 HD domain-containing protein [Clostridium sp. MB40-C1]